MLRNSVIGALASQTEGQWLCLGGNVNEARGGGRNGPKKSHFGGGQQWSFGAAGQAEGGCGGPCIVSGVPSMPVDIGSGQPPQKKGCFLQNMAKEGALWGVNNGRVLREWVSGRPLLHRSSYGNVFGGPRHPVDRRRGAAHTTGRGLSTAFRRRL